MLVSSEGENLTACHVNLCSPVDFKGSGNGQEQSWILVLKSSMFCEQRPSRLPAFPGEGMWVQTAYLCSFAAPSAVGIDEHAKEQSKSCSQLCPLCNTSRYCISNCFKLSSPGTVPVTGDAVTRMRCIFGRPRTYWMTVPETSKMVPWAYVSIQLRMKRPLAASKISLHRLAERSESCLIHFVEGD